MSFHAAGENIVGALKRGMYESAIEIMRESQIRVPVDTSTLKQSARVGEPVQVGDKVVLEMGYGYGVQVNPLTGHIAAQYAVPVHERLDQKHAPPTSAKYLELPLLEYAAKYGRTLETWISRYVRDPNAADLRRFEERIT